jgi:hypothetical protein
VHQSFAAVSADYDKVEGFFAYSNRFFDRLQLIEGKTRNAPPFARCIVRVFSCMLSICGIAHAMTQEKRFKQWLNALWNLEDKELGAAYAAMQGAIEELGSAVNYASYKEIATTHDEVGEANEKLDQLDSRVGVLREELQSMNMSLDQVVENVVGIRSEMFDQFVGVHSHLDSMEANLTTTFLASSQAIMNAIMKSQEKKTSSDQHDKSKKPEAKTGKRDVGDKKFAAIKKIKDHFDSKYSEFPQWSTAATELKVQRADIKDNLLPNTGEWLLQDETFKSWMDGQNPLLWLKGPDGIGKTFLAYAVTEKISELSKSEGHKAFAYFYFREEHPYLQSTQNALACAALQLAEADPRYAEAVAADLRKQEEGKGSEEEPSTWKRFFTSRFTTPSTKETHPETYGDLFLIFDGLDEAHEDQRKSLVQAFGELAKEKSKIHVLITSRPEKTPSMESLDALTIDITRDKIITDIKALIRNRLQSLARLKKFTRPVKKTIYKKLSAKADSMLYVEHMLRRLSYIGREGAVLKDLAKMPENLHDLYKLLLEECKRNRSEEQYQALKKLFAWLAFSKTPLSLSEASALIKMTVSDEDFDLEDEIIGRSARILELSRSRELDEDAEETAKEEDDDDKPEAPDGPPEDMEYRNAAITFQERSLREYFRVVSLDIEDEDMRTPATTAHLTIMGMCADILVRYSKSSKDSEAGELINYAANYWYEHLNELAPEDASEEETKSVLEILHIILSNTDNMAHAFEVISYDSALYPEKPESGTIWFDNALEWLKKGQSLPEDTLPENIKIWLSGLKDNPKDVLLPLLKGHIANWYSGERRWSIFESYRFAKAAAKLVRQFPVVVFHLHN